MSFEIPKAGVFGNLYCQYCGPICKGWKRVASRVCCMTCNAEMVVITKDENSWAILSDKLALRPIGNKILILEDKFKTGLECKTCNGEGHTDELCPNCQGTKFEEGEDINGELTNFACRSCTVGQAGMKKTYGYKLCPDCGGKQATIIIPDDNQRRPTTGKILAIGEKVNEYKVGAKVLYTNYTGSEFIMEDFNLRVMSEHDVLCECKFLKAEQSLEIEKKKEVVESGIV